MATLEVHLWTFETTLSPQLSASPFSCSENLAELDSFLDKAQSSAAHQQFAVTEHSTYALSCSVATNHTWPI